MFISRLRAAEKAKDNTNNNNNDNNKVCANELQI